MPCSWEGMWRIIDGDYLGWQYVEHAHLPESREIMKPFFDLQHQYYLECLSMRTAAEAIIAHEMVTRDTAAFDEYKKNLHS